MPTAAMFLDYSSFQEARPSTLVSCISIGQEVREYVLGDSRLQESIDTFMNIFDAWMSFIPRKELRSKVSDTLHQPTGEDILLLACIKILTQPLTEDNPYTKQYLAIKSAFLGAEISGAITLRLLQALLLLLFYEFGQGIYPGTYTTLGTCTRYLVALGLDGAGPCSSEPVGWMEIETQRRVWWAVYVMER